MATLELIYKFREMIGDYPIKAFNRAVADGVNASWVLTNKPVELASESLYLGGITQIVDSAVAALTADAVAGAYEVEVDDTTNLAVDDEFSLSSEPDPDRYKIIGINNLILSLNRALSDSHASGTTVSKITKGYTISYKYGIIYFDSPPALNTIMTCHYNYFKNSNAVINTILDQAANEISIDIDEDFDFANTDHVTLLLLKGQIMLLNKDIIIGAGSAIKVKSGSTSLDLVGANRALKDQASVIAARYSQALLRYMNNKIDGELGSGVVGPEAYLNE